MDFAGAYADACIYGASLFLKATAVLVVAWLISTLLRRRSAALRHAVWAIALSAALTLPIFSLWMPPLEVDVARIETAIQRFQLRQRTTEQAGAPAAQQIEAHPGIRGSAQVQLVESGSPIRSETRRSNPAFYILAVWLSVALGLTGVFTAHVARIRRITRRGESNTEISTIAGAVSAHLSVTRQVRVLIGQVSMPMTWGLLRPAVLLPPDALDWSSDRLRIVLIHELAHVQRRDYASHLAAELSCILYWPNPLVWMARHRLRIEQEHACDDAVLRAGTASFDYAEHLVEIARTLQSRSLFAGAVWMAGKHGLKARVRLILDPHIERRGASALAFMCLLIAIGITALSTAALRAAHEEIDPEDTTTSARDTELASAGGDTQSDVAIESPSVPLDSLNVAIEGEPIYTLVREAESGRIVPPMSVHEDGAASGARFVMVPDAGGNDPPDGGPGQITVEFDLEADVSHRIWARVIGDGDNDNSFFVSIDDDDEFIWDIKDRHGDLVRRWRWLPVKDREGRAATLDGGKHSLTFRNREDGSLLDAIFITSDPDLVPKGRTPLAPPAESVSISVEAEKPATLIAPLEIRADDTASERLYLAVADGFDSRHSPPDDGRAVYHLRIPRAGSYMCWARIIAPNNDANSFWVRANGSEWIRWNDMEKDDDWSWQLLHDSDVANDVALLSLEVGENELEIAYREDGAKIDRLFLTNNPLAFPWENEDAPSNVTVVFRD